MSVHEITATGREALALATALLQRGRLADPLAGLWDAADPQWWSRKARPSDVIEQVFWSDGQGPVAGVYLTCWASDSWQCDPITIPGVMAPGIEVVWARAVEQIGGHAAGNVEVPICSNHRRLQDLARASGLVPGEESGTAWMAGGDRPAVVAPPAGFVLTDRTQRPGTAHPMRHRNGNAVEERLGQCSLYDPELDLAVETADGQTVGYSLYWFDPVTRVGLVEPVRVEDEYARLGLARAMLIAGIDRLARRGAQRIKIGYGSEEASALYQGVGFRHTSTDTAYEGQVTRLS